MFFAGLSADAFHVVIFFLLFVGLFRTPIEDYTVESPILDCSRADFSMLKPFQNYSKGSEYIVPFSEIKKIDFGKWEVLDSGFSVECSPANEGFEKNGNLYCKNTVLFVWSDTNGYIFDSEKTVLHTVFRKKGEMTELVGKECRKYFYE